jgi:hypothetical protein
LLVSFMISKQALDLEWRSLIHRSLTELLPV